MSVPQPRERDVVTYFFFFGAAFFGAAFFAAGFFAAAFFTAIVFTTFPSPISSGKIKLKPPHQHYFIP